MFGDSHRCNHEHHYEKKPIDYFGKVVQKSGGTNLLSTAFQIDASSKVKIIYQSPRSHSKVLIEGTNGELCEAWLFTLYNQFCACAFFADLEPFQRQALGCKHLLAHAIRLKKIDQLETLNLFSLPCQ